MSRFLRNSVAADLPQQRLTPLAKLLVSPEEAAEILSLSVRRIYELIAQGRIRSYKIGKVRRIPLEALREYIAKLEAEQPA